MIETDPRAAVGPAIAWDRSVADFDLALSGPPSGMQALVDGIGPTGSGVWGFREPNALIEARNQRELEAACLAIDKASRSCHVILLIDYEDFGSRPSVKKENWSFGNGVAQYAV